jgi:hypothetical protein
VPYKVKLTAWWEGNTTAELGIFVFEANSQEEANEKVTNEGWSRSRQFPSCDGCEFEWLEKPVLLNVSVPVEIVDAVQRVQS